jgi:hypothetical protein
MSEPKTGLASLGLDNAIRLRWVLRDIIGKRLKFSPIAPNDLQTRHISTMANFVFKCPVTGFNVQHKWDDDPDVSDNEYEAIACPACTRIHLVNRRSGKLLGQDD